MYRGVTLGRVCWVVLVWALLINVELVASIANWSDHPKLFTGREELHPHLEAQLRACSAGQQIRIMGYLLDFNTLLGTHTLKENVLHARKNGCDVAIVVDSTKADHQLVLLMNFRCLAYGSRCVVLASPMVHGGLVLHTKLFSSEDSCILSSGDIEDVPWYDTALEVRHTSACERLNRMFDGIWNEYKPQWTKSRIERKRETRIVDPRTQTHIEVLLGYPVFDGFNFNPAHQTRRFSRVYLDAVRNANDSIFVSDQYMNWETLSKLLLEKVNEGVNVNIVTNDGPWGNLKSEHHQTLFQLRDHPNVTYVQATCEYIHMKSLVVDDHLLIMGSTVINPSSFVMQYEASFLVRGEQVQVIAKQLRLYLQGAEMCDGYQGWYDRKNASRIKLEYIDLHDWIEARTVATADSMAIWSGLA